MITFEQLKEAIPYQYAQYRLNEAEFDYVLQTLVWCVNTNAVWYTNTLEVTINHNDKIGSIKCLRGFSKPVELGLRDVKNIIEAYFASFPIELTFQDVMEFLENENEKLDSDYSWGNIESILESLNKRFNLKLATHPTSYVPDVITLVKFIRELKD